MFDAMEAEDPDGFILVPSKVHQHFGELAATLPGLAAAWAQHLQTRYPGASVDELSDVLTGFSYLDMNVFTNWIAEHLAQQDVAHFGAFFQQANFMLTCGDERTEELTAMGLLEGMQNCLAHAGFDHHTALDRWLPPPTKQFWDDLNNFWEGK